MGYKIVINKCHGGFDLSDKALSLYNKYNDSIRNPKMEYLSRHDPLLIKVVEELGEKDSSGDFSDLGIVEIDQPLYYIHEYDGYEYVVTPQSIKWQDASKN